MASVHFTRAARRAALLAVLVLPALVAPAQASLPDRIVHAARVELGRGVHETPNGSNESTGIARYRKAVRWSSPRTPWCGYFVSYVAQRAGAPLGESGEGIGAVSEIRRWGKRTKRWSTTPHRGSIAVFRGHVGIVERVAGSQVVTIEGNHSNRVARVWHSRSEVRGYVQLHSVPKAAAPRKRAPASGDDEVDAPADDTPATDDEPGAGDDDPGDDGGDDTGDPEADLFDELP
jgi:uncharacterized protein (TIGR02594 family)